MSINIDSHQVFPEKNIKKINREICFHYNPKTGLFLKENPHLIDKDILNDNDNDWAVNFLISNPEYINNIFSLNENDKTVDFLINNPQYINIVNFSLNENDKAIEFLINNLQYLDIKNFSLNENYKAVDFLINNPEYINI